MASGKWAWGICDECGFRYKLRTLKFTSYGTQVCSTCFDGEYDLQNHPQNFSAPGGDDESISNISPEDPFVYVTVSAVPIGPGLWLNLDTGETTIAP